MSNTSKAVGVFAPAPWEAACAVVGRPTIPFAAVKRPESGVKVADRLALGRETFAAADGDPPLALLDSSAGGLQFIEGPGGLTDLRLVHETLGVPLISQFTRSVAATFDALAWPMAWACLNSRTWIKALPSAAAVAELERLGVPQVIHVPAAAPDREYPVAPLSEFTPGRAVSCVGEPAATFFDPSKQARTAGLRDAAIVRAARADLGEGSFAEIYYDLYGLADPPSPQDDAETRQEKARRYFAARLYHEASLAVQQRDRFALFLTTMLPGQFQVSGAGWGERYGLPADALPDDPDARVRHYRQSGINLVLGNGWFEDGPSPEHFEVTAAGGFMLCYRQPGVEEIWKPGVECDTFGNEQELLEKARHYLGNAEARRDIALAGQRRTLSQHLYSHRVEALLARADRVQRESAEGRAVGTPVPVGTRPAASVQDTPPSLLILQNPGRCSRYYLSEMEQAARRLGIRTLVQDLTEVWQLPPGQRPAAAAEMERMLRRENVRAVIGYTANGTSEWPCAQGPDGSLLTLFDRLGIVHLLWWTDHPQWAGEKAALGDQLQPLLRGGCKHHFLKSDVHARELTDLLGWKNCHGLPVAEDPDFVRPLVDPHPDYDVVAIVGCPPRPVPELDPFLEESQPDTAVMQAIVAEQGLGRLDTLWRERAPAALHGPLTVLGGDWLRRRRDDPRTPGYDHFRVLADNHPEASGWLRDHPRAYFDAAEILWSFLSWQRTFVLRYLAQFFRVAVFGHDWSSVGIPGGGWVDYREQGKFYARGRVAINIAQGNEEEGASHKPFQIAASGVAQVHIDRRGLSDYFEPHREVEYFETPAQARRVIAELLGDDDRRQAMARAARERLLRDHTWDVRLPEMFALAGVDWGPRAAGAAPRPPVADPRSAS